MKGSSFPGFISPIEVLDSKSVVGVNPDDSSVITGCQVDQFTHMWSAEGFIVKLQMYPKFTGKMSTLTYLPPEPGCENYSSWNKQLQTVSMILIPF